MGQSKTVLHGCRADYFVPADSSQLGDVFGTVDIFWVTKIGQSVFGGMLKW
jgi:hypothetical protein